MGVNQHIYCAQCGYDLFGLDSKLCPECGQPFNPDRPETYYDTPPEGRKARWWAVVCSSVVLLISFGLGVFLSKFVYMGWIGSMPVTVPICVGLAGYVIPFGRWLRQREMVLGIVLVELFFLVWMLSYWADVAIEELLVINVTVICPWIVTIYLIDH